MLLYVYLIPKMNSSYTLHTIRSRIAFQSHAVMHSYISKLSKKEMYIYLITSTPQNNPNPNVNDFLFSLAAAIIF